MSEQNKQPIWKKILYQIRLIASRDDSALLSNPTFAKEWQRQNLVACLTISAMAALLGLIGLLGTFSPLSEETVLSWINATIAYSLILFINLSFFFMFGQMIQRFVTDGRTSVSTIMHFLRMEMLLASTTFFSTQTGSSFFFEYLLVSMAVYLVPLYRHSDLPGLVTLNLVPTALIILLIRPSTVWQDLVDLCIFHVFCLAMVFLRWYSFQQYESVHINLMSLNSELFGQSRRDGLTGLLNRAALRDDFPRFIGHPVCVALIDLDYFKQINDTYGHQFGDRILIFVSKTLKSVFSHPDDFCYRYGGDEMLVLSISNDPDGFQARLEELQRQCMYSDPTGFQTEMSIGTCSGAPADETSLRSFIRTADRKLYQEKTASIRTSSTAARRSNHSCPPDSRIFRASRRCSLVPKKLCRLLRQAFRLHLTRSMHKRALPRLFRLLRQAHHLHLMNPAHRKMLASSPGSSLPSLSSTP